MSIRNTADFRTDNLIYGLLSRTQTLAALSGIRRRLDIADMKVAEGNTYLTLDDLREVVRAGRPATTRKSGASKGKEAPSQSILAILYGLADKFDTDISQKAS